MTFDARVRLAIYEHFITNGCAPLAADLSRSMKVSRDEIDASLHRLAGGRLLILQPASGEIYTCPPFSAVPQAFHVESRGRSWDAICAWEALGIPALLNEDADVQTACGDCGEALTLRVGNGKLEDSAARIHFVVPAKHWWDNIVFT